jgi:superfamily II DNA/RNA helicase
MFLFCKRQFSHVKISYKIVQYSTETKKSSMLLFPSIIQKKPDQSNTNFGQLVLNQLKTADTSLVEGKRAQKSVIDKIKQRIDDSDLISSFKKIGVSPFIAQAMVDNFQATTPNQTQSLLIPAILSNSEILLKDQTGSGKTLGLLLGVLSKKGILEGPNTSILIISPSNHLAIQTYQWIQALLPKEYHDTIHCIVTMGSLPEQQRLLTLRVPRIIIGTPKRLLELYESKHLNVTSLKVLVLDEVDKMVLFPQSHETIKQKFYKRVHTQPCDTLVSKIISSTNKESEERDIYQITQKRLQVIVCSATLNGRMRNNLKSARKWITEPVVLDMCDSKDSPTSMTHHCVVIEESGKVRDLIVKTEANKKVYVKQIVEKKKVAKKVSVVKVSDFDPCLEIVNKLASEFNVEKGLVFADSNLSMSTVASRLSSLGTKTKRFWVDLNEEVLLDSSQDIPSAEEIQYVQQETNSLKEKEAECVNKINFSEDLFRNDVKLICLEERNLLHLAYVYTAEVIHSPLIVMKTYQVFHRL